MSIENRETSALIFCKNMEKNTLTSGNFKFNCSS